MKKITIVLTAILLNMFTVQSIAMKGFFKKVGDEIAKEAAKTVAKGVNASIGFRNESNFTIYVVMDNNRESHTIPPGGTGTFSNAKIGDAPTFRVYKESNKKHCIYSRKVDPRTTLQSSFGFNGMHF